MVVKLPNGGHLNWVFELIGVSYAPRPFPGTEAFATATKKHKAGMSKKVKVASIKTVLAKTSSPKKTSTIKIIRPKPKPGPRGMFEIDWFS
jgi:hypothetical protein